MRNKTGIVLLARMSSRRLPGKVLCTLSNGKSVLEFIVSRLAKAKFEVALAISNDAMDDPLCRKGLDLGIRVFRGGLNNVAKRFYECAEWSGLDYAFRINGDNVFTDPQLICQLHSKVMAESSDFGSNVEGRTFPTGMSVELVNVDFYGSILPKIVDVNHQEHVTSWLYANPTIGRRSYIFNEKYPGLNNAKLALDTFDDLKRVNDIIMVCERKGIPPEFSNIQMWLES